MHTLGVRFSATNKKFALLPEVWLQFQAHVTKYFSQRCSESTQCPKTLTGAFHHGSRDADLHVEALKTLQRTLAQTMLSRPDKDLVENSNYVSIVIPQKLKQKLGLAMTTDTQSDRRTSKSGSVNP